MTSSNYRFWEGEEWEKHIQLLLKRHYGPGDYQEVPARHVGDFGIEGYSTDGCAFQCYATQEPCTTQQRYEAQRNKITTDIGKFVNNKADLVKLFGDTVIRRWILVVPVSESALLMQHASKKAEEVLRVKPPYVSDDFKIFIDTDSCFAMEINELATKGVISIDIQNLEVRQENCNDWLRDNNVLVNRLEEKARKIPKLSANDKVEEFKLSIINHYLRGQNLWDNLNKYPDIYAKLEACKRSYEHQMVTMSLCTSNPAGQYLTEAQKKYSYELQNSVPHLPPEMIKTLSWEGISDWLMRCPLDF
jgi:hypothetical protein